MTGSTVCARVYLRAHKKRTHAHISHLLLICDKQYLSVVHYITYLRCHTASIPLHNTADSSSMAYSSGKNVKYHLTSVIKKK